MVRAKKRAAPASAPKSATRAIVSPSGRGVNVIVAPVVAAVIAASAPQGPPWPSTLRSAACLTCHA
jgi:hypothetical protein